ncbi:hypothetical protein VNO78_17417 [Psophocarpus tetragonolobus]|uniref:C2H2-type domain-containing protein n=1 Tax=Psophocarpus tetragonolobus TaxID=3891 RepID=A0AAN9XL73_PSOTE
MDLNYPEECCSKSSSEENKDDMMGSGRPYECIFCKRGFTTAQALGGHMNIHRKERANKSKPSFPSLPSSSHSHKVDAVNNYADLGFYSQIPTHSTAPHANTFLEPFFPATAPSIRPSHDQRDHVFAQDWWKSNLTFYTNPLCFREIQDKFEESEENGLDLELRLGHHP